MASFFRHNFPSAKINLHTRVEQFAQEICIRERRDLLDFACLWFVWRIRFLSHQMMVDDNICIRIMSFYIRVDSATRNRLFFWFISLSDDDDDDEAMM